MRLRSYRSVSVSPGRSAEFSAEFTDTGKSLCTCSSGDAGLRLLPGIGCPYRAGAIPGSSTFWTPEDDKGAAQVAFSDEISADRAEDVADDIDRRLTGRLQPVPHVFLDPTQAPSG